MNAVQTKPSEEQLKEVQDGKGLKSLVYTDAGVFVEDTPPDVVARNRAAIHLVQDEEAQSIASAALLRFREARGEHIQPVLCQWNGEVVFEAAARRISYAQFAEMGALMGARSVGFQALPTLDSQEIFWAAFFVVGIIKSEAEPTPFFGSIDEAFAFQNEPGMDTFILQICDALCELNPHLKKALLDGTGATALADELALLGKASPITPPMLLAS